MSDDSDDDGLEVHYGGNDVHSEHVGGYHEGGYQENVNDGFAIAATARSRPAVPWCSMRPFESTADFACISSCRVVQRVSFVVCPSWPTVLTTSRHPQLRIAGNAGSAGSSEELLRDRR